jgi:hypothetical protein
MCVTSGQTLDSVVVCFLKRMHVSDPIHHAVGQTYPRGRGAVIRCPRRGEREVQFVDAETAGSDSVEFLQLVLPS